MEISRVRGTEDFLDLRLYNHVRALMVQHVTTYNFTEIDTPILEHTNLFVRAVGTDTDVVSKEMYIFNTAGGESLCLRPEPTASANRAFLENSIDAKPWKVFTCGPMFRHERPQKGRWRQFVQFSLEVINSSAIAHDAQLIKMLDSFFTDKLLLESYVLKMNFLGCSADRAAHRVALRAYLDTLDGQICQTCTVRKEKNILRVFDCKNEQCSALYRTAPILTDFLCEPCGTEWQSLQDMLRMLSVNFVHDPFLVRGLDYYNGVVFEFISTDLGAQNTFCGGGRYELATSLGASTPVPSVGAGLGMGRLLLMLQAMGSTCVPPAEAPLHLILPFAPEQQPLGLMLAHELQRHGLRTDMLVDNPSVKSMMRKADKMNAAYVLIIGENEQNAGTVSVKNMASGESSTVKQVELVKVLLG